MVPGFVHSNWNSLLVWTCWWL